MSRNATTEADELVDTDLGAALADGATAPERDEHGFWKGPSDEPLDMPDEDESIEVERETRVYMGHVRHADADRDELETLADWAEGKACAGCFAETEADPDHDLGVLPHRECSSALRAARLLRRYP